MRIKYVGAVHIGVQEKIKGKKRVVSRFFSINKNAFDFIHRI